jgi:hypothetical protein
MSWGTTVVDLDNRAASLREYCPVDRSHDEVGAYFALMPLKSLLAQRWFHIPIHPKLENQSHSALKGHASVHATKGFVMATAIPPGAIYKSRYLPYFAVASPRTQYSIKKVYFDKSYYGRSNSGFFSLQGITDVIMKKDTSRHINQ